MFSIDDIAPPPAQTSPIDSRRDKDTCSFSAVLEAERRKAAQQEAYRGMRDEIAEKGFSNWVRDTRMESLKEKLRRMVMAEMGLDEEQMGRMSALVQQVLEQKIAEEVERRMAEQGAEDPDAEGAGTAEFAGQPAENDRRSGVPVIPALVTPGGSSLG